VTFHLIAAAIVVAIVIGILSLRHHSSPPAPPLTTYVVLVRTQAPTPSETVTAWNAYEAAPQEASSPEDAIASFRHDSGLDGEMKAVPLSEWRP
jgi:hypothetical protein